MKAAKALFIFVVMATSILFNVRPAKAAALSGEAVSKGQSGVELENVSASVMFGEGITFLATIKASIQIQNVSIVIFDEAQGLTHVKPLEIRADGTTEYFFDTRQNTLRPFTNVSWSYQFTLADGNTFQSETFFIRYDDDRFTWQTLESGSIRMHWYNGDVSFGQAALNSAQSGLQSISALLPLDLARPVDIFIYANATDLRGTLYSESEAWVAGHANSAVGVVMVVVEPGANQSIFMEQRIPHELMHVMLYRSIGAGYDNLPAWLREGTATLAEVSPNPDYDLVLAAAGANNTMISIKDLCASFPPNADTAFLAYAESRSFIHYLQSTYGSAKLLSLVSIYADGVDCERGTENAYGVSLSKLEMDWRASVLGQNAILPALLNLSPYLFLLCLILLIPLIGILSVMRKKGNRHEPESYA
ncbi:MAG: peptidase MA family metallohydrolase [Anaerolineales bacterium]